MWLKRKDHGSGPHDLKRELSLGIQSHFQRIIGVSNHLLRIVFRLPYHSQKVSGSVGMVLKGSATLGC